MLDRVKKYKREREWARKKNKVSEINKKFRGRVRMKERNWERERVRERERERVRERLWERQRG